MFEDFTAVVCDGSGDDFNCMEPILLLFEGFPEKAPHDVW